MTTVLPSPEKPTAYEIDNDEKEAFTPTSVTHEQKPPLAIPVEDAGSGGFWGRLKKSHLDLDSIATQPSVFDDPVTCEFYRPPPQYENTHRFDPSARWTWREEKVKYLMSVRSLHFSDAQIQALTRKIDWRVMLWAGIMFFALDLDRSNISQVKLFALSPFVPKYLSLPGKHGFLPPRPWNDNQ